MVEFWNSILSFERFFWIIAVPSTVIFIIQAVMTFFGLDHGHDTSGDVLNDITHGHDHSLSNNEQNLPEALDIKFKLFTIRSVIAFFTVFSWTGIVATRQGFSAIVSTLAAIVLGFILMLIVSFIYYSAQRLTEEGTMDINNAVGMEGEVYLTIPKREEGMGKVQIEVQGALRTIDAVTYGEELFTGEKVTVIRIIDNEVLLVEKIN